MISYILVEIGVIAIVLFFVYLKKRQDEQEENFEKRFSGKNIKLLDKTANAEESA